MTDIIVSVIMPVYKAEKYIDIAIESILGQTFKDFELIIIDDCGNDDSMTYVRELSDERIRIISNERNMGISFSRNIGIENARGQYIALMDDDDIAPAERFEIEVNYLNDHPEIDVVAGGALWIDETGNMISYCDQIICNPKRIKAELLFQDVIENGSAMFRREFVIKNNIRYQDGFLGMEDYKFWTDCSVFGALANVSDTLLYWRKSNDSESSRIHRSKAYERQKKFAEIQISLMKNYGFFLDDEEIRVFTECFKEDKRESLTRIQLNEVYKLTKKLIRIAKDSKIDYLDEFNLVLKRRFAQKLEYSELWNDDLDLLIETRA